MKKYTISTISRLTPGIVLVSLQADSSKDTIFHKPGQYAAIGFHVNGRPSPMRCFSIVNAPNTNGVLQFAIRVGGSFTQTLAELEHGTRVFVQGPFGEFVPNPRYDRSVIMLAGGIGITPFMSMLRNAAATQSKVPMTLLYSCQSQSDIPFFEELHQLESQNPMIRVYFFISTGTITPVAGANIRPGRIGESTLSDLTAERFNMYSYFLCGPTGFIGGMHDALIAKGTNPQRIVSEAFSQIPVGRTAEVAKSLPRMVYGVTSFAMIFGVCFIMTLDLVRAVPKIAYAEAQQQTQSTQVMTAATATPTATDMPSTQDTDMSSLDDSSSNSVSSTSTATPTPVATPTPQTQVQTYQQPVTSVS